MEYSKNELAGQLYEVAIGLVESGRSDMAENTYQMALQLDPNDFASITNLAVIIDKSGRLDQAEGLYLKAAAYPFYDALAMFNLGYLYGRTDREALAETWYRRTLVAKPDHCEAMVNLAG
jgi:Flp pilus assembly protein TadD